MNKDDVEMKLERLIGREVTINEKMKHSSPHLSMYAGMTGILKAYDIGEWYEDIFANVEFVLIVNGKKGEFTMKQEVWMNSLDIKDISSE